MWRRSWRPSRIVLSLAAIAIAVLYVIYSWVDPLPPRHLAIAAGPTGSGYDNAARRYARILARHRVQLEVRNSAGARSRPWPETPFSRMVLVFLSPARPKRDVG